jgi:hypothetical protein
MAPKTGSQTVKDDKSSEIRPIRQAHQINEAPKAFPHSLRTKQTFVSGTVSVTTEPGFKRF